MKCKTCGKHFKLRHESRYEVLVRESFITKPTTYNAFDCPKCGCQNLVSIKETEFVKGTCDDGFFVK